MKVSTLQLAFGFSVFTHGLALSLIPLIAHRHITAEYLPTASPGSDECLEVTLVFDPTITRDVVDQSVKGSPEALSQQSHLGSSDSIEALPFGLPSEQTDSALDSSTPEQAHNTQPPVADTRQILQDFDRTMILDGPPCSDSTHTGTFQGQAKVPAGYLVNPKPAYPKQAQERGQQGEVLLAVYVTSNGFPASIAVRRSSAFHLLDEAAVRAVKEWRFVPAHQGNVEVESQIEIPIQFHISK